MSHLEFIPGEVEVGEAAGAAEQSPKGLCSTAFEPILRQAQLLEASQALDESICYCHTQGVCDATLLQA